MRVLRIENFITSKESKILSEWILENINQEFFQNAKAGIGSMKGNPDPTRKTTRYSDHISFEYPKEALEIRKKIINLFDLSENEEKKLIPPFKDGIVASYAKKEDTLWEHIDPAWFDGLDTLHCNILTQAPEKGGEVIIEEKKYNMKENELFCYRVSKHKHEVLKVEGERPRLMWVFGFCINENQWRKVVDCR